MRLSRSTHVEMCCLLKLLTSIIRTGLPILVELIFQVISVAIFLSHVNLLRWLIFLLGSWTVILTVLLFWIYLFLRRLVFVLQWFLLHWEILIMLLSQFSLSFHHIHNRLPCFIALLMNILMLIGTVFVIIWDVPWEDIFKLCASVSASDFFEWVQVGIDVNIPHRKYQVNPHISPWFSAACAAAIVHRNHFFCLCQKDKSSESIVTFKHASNCCKRVLEPAKLGYANKTRVHHFPEIWLPGLLANCQ